MDNTGAVMIEGEDYQVVDECIDEEDTTNSMQQKSENTTDATKDTCIDSVLQNTSDPNDISNQQQEQQNDEKERKKQELCLDSSENIRIDTQNIDDSAKKNIPNRENECLNQINVETIDFTADISLDQLDEQKDMTDEDVLNHLDEIENIVLDPSTFQIHEENEETCQEDMKLKSCIKQESPEVKTCESVIINQKVPFVDKNKIKQEIQTESTENKNWYDRKLAEKETIIKERLSKVARVLAISYPLYEKWLEREEQINGSPLCRVKPSRRCSLDKPYTNRWKFICSKKSVQESTKKMDDADTSVNKNIEAIWRLEATGAWGVNTNNEFEFPPFVLRAVKIFEEFLQTTEQPVIQDIVTENFSDDISMELDSKKDTNNEVKQQWLWLLVRCNSMDELMLFATGKNISRSTMDRLKQVYESGPGKDCNVKSLYCKSVNRCDDTTVTTFLVGSEALDEKVGGIKVQLAPKTNFWSNAAGAENVGKAVIDLLAPTPKTTVLEIGCGIGLIGLMMASKCQKVIGVDSASEVEEAEMTCELNNIKNVSFIMGSPSEVTSKISAAVKNRKTSAVINANTNLGRAIEVMTCLRKVVSLKKIVMITTLTKQSVRAILELARPVDRNLGHPFIPTMACVVDTLPVGPHFEAVILMQRRIINKSTQLRFHKTDESTKPGEMLSTNIKSQEKIEEQESNTVDKGVKGLEFQAKKNAEKLPAKLAFIKKQKATTTKKTGTVKNTENLPAKTKFKGKRLHSPEKNEAPPKKLIKQFDKFGPKPWRTDLTTKKKKDWVPGNTQIRVNPLYEKKLREHKEQADLRERLSSNRIDTDIAQKVKEHQAMLEIAKEKLSGSAPTVDVTTAKQLQSMLNMVLEQTNKLQSQLPRSVWDRIAPPEIISHSDRRENKQDDLLLKGRYVQEMGSEDILITTENKKFNTEEPAPKPIYRKYNNVPPLEPNTIMPVCTAISSSGREGGPFQESPERYHAIGSDIRKQQTQGNSWNRNKIFEKNRWNDDSGLRKTNSPIRRQTSPIKHRASPPRRFSPKRPLLSPPRRPCSPPRRHFSPLRRPTSPFRQRSPLRRQVSPHRRTNSPLRRVLLPSRVRRPIPEPRHTDLPSVSRPISPFGSTTVIHDPTISSRRQVSPTGRAISPPTRQMLSPPIQPERTILLSVSRRQTMPANPLMASMPPITPMPSMSARQDRQDKQGRQGRQDRQDLHVSPARRGGSPHRFPFGRPGSPPRQQRQPSPERQQLSPPSGFTDDWDIPSRGAIEQNTWIRPNENVWNVRSSRNVRNERTSTSTLTSNSNVNWEESSVNDRYRKIRSLAQDSSCEDPTTWNNGGRNWSSKQTSSIQGPNNRWSSIPVSNTGPSGDNWNIRGKESFTVRDDPWMEGQGSNRWESSNIKDCWKQADKDDWNDLPEDARDPWGDDGSLGLKERWLKLDNSTSSSTWMREMREGEQRDSWSKQKDNWQNKGQSLSSKPHWQNNENRNKSSRESRWIPQNEMGRKVPSNNWQSGSNLGFGQSQSFNFQSKRPFSTTQYKDLC